MPKIDYDKVQEMYDKMIVDSEQVILSLTTQSYRKHKGETKEYFVWSCDVDNKSEGGEIWMLPFENEIEGVLYEMIPHNDFALILTDDFENGEEVTKQVIKAILDPLKHIKVRWAETEEPEPVDEEDEETEYIYFAKLIRANEKLPENYTGRFFKVLENLDFAIEE